MPLSKEHMRLFLWMANPHPQSTPLYATNRHSCLISREAGGILLALSPPNRAGWQRDCSSSRPSCATVFQCPHRLSLSVLSLQHFINANSRTINIQTCKSNSRQHENIYEMLMPGPVPMGGKCSCRGREVIHEASKVHVRRAADLGYILSNP